MHPYKQALARYRKHFHNGRVYHSIDGKYLARHRAEMVLTDHGVYLTELRHHPIIPVDRLPADPRAAHLPRETFVDLLRFHRLRQPAIDAILSCSP